MKAAELLGRLHIRRGIKDPELRRAVTPDYEPDRPTLGLERFLFKRFPALQRALWDGD